MSIRATRVRRAEAKMKMTLARVLGMVALGAIGAGGLVSSACSSVQADPDDDGGVCGRRQVAEDAGDDAPITCSHFFQQPCGLPDEVQVIPLQTGFSPCVFNFNDCTTVCGGPYENCHVYGEWCLADGGVQETTQDSSIGGVVVECGSCVGIAGRRPDGLRDAVTSHAADAVGKYFAEAAFLEAASVHAFRILRRELASFKAPRDLLDAAKRAEADEVKHTRMTRKLARAHGAMPPKVRVVKKANRTLEEIALENAVEGCVRETYAALVAMWQAERAADPEIADAMKEIAIDETRHAALAWSVAEWADAHLDAEARDRVIAAKTKAISDLEKEIAIDPHPDLISRAGMPTARQQKNLLTEMAKALAA